MSYILNAEYQHRSQLQVKIAMQKKIVKQVVGEKKNCGISKIIHIEESILQSTAYSWADVI